MLRVAIPRENHRLRYAIRCKDSNEKMTYNHSDAGIHPAHSGMASLPFIDELDWSTVDAILITQ
jgi:hypothetical protein